MLGRLRGDDDGMGDDEGEHDEEADPKTTLDTFAHDDGHASFVLTYRPDKATIESWHTQIDQQQPVVKLKGKGKGKMPAEEEENREGDDAAKLWERLDAERGLLGRAASKRSRK